MSDLFDKRQIHNAADFFAKTFFILSAIVLLSPNLSAQKKDDPKQAIALRAQAEEGQNQKDFKFAAKTWEKLLIEFPNCSFVDDARYQCGVCYFNLGDYKNSAKKFEETIKSVADKKDYLYTEPCYLYLGFSQFQIGENEKDPAKSKPQIKTAISTFDEMLKKFPTGKYADQGLLFRGEAHEVLKNYPRAASNYQQIIDNFESSMFFLESHYKLGYVLSRMKKSVEAEKMLTEYVTKATAQNEKAKTDSKVQKIDENKIKNARFDIAESTRVRGESALNAKRVNQANKLFGEAQKMFASLATDEDFRRWDVAAYQSALCLRQQKKFPAAAAAFEKLANSAKTAYAADAGIQAGRCYFDANDLKNADKWFDKMRKDGGRYALEAAHFQTQILLKQNKNEAAASLAKAAMQFGSKDKPFYAQLQMDYADALYQQREKRGESVDVYLDIVKSFPKSELAPQAAYYAAFAAQENAEFDRAIKLVDQFLEDFPRNIYQPDALQVKADSLVQLRKYKDAITVFDSIIKDFASHENAGTWQVRRAACQYFDGNTDAIETDLASRIDSIKPKAAKALGYYWIGVCRFDNKKWELAAEAVKKSLNIDTNHRRAAEATLLLARSQFLQNEIADAIKTAKAGAKKFAKTNMAERFSYRLGEFEYENKNYSAAADHYLDVIKNSKNKQLVPNAYYSLAWSQLKLKQNESAIDSFTQLIKRYRNHDLVDDAKLGRGMTYRQANKHQAAIDDLSDFVKTSKDANKKFNARYEIALSQIAMKSLEPAIKNLRQLLDEDSKSKLADRICYELAWAYRDNKKLDDAIKYFEKLSKDYQNSPFAAEAFFHLGQADYDDKDYESAIENYSQCVAKTKNKTHAEKAAYKLAWSQFQQKKYKTAKSSFEKQLADHPRGELAADGYFMVAECLFRQKKHSEAVTAYKVAMPKVINGNVAEQVKLQTLLHGAQSANKAGKFSEAITFAEQITKQNKDDAYNYEANLELGIALKGQKEFDTALEALERATTPINETGARAYFMIGEIRFEERKFDEAITAFKKVIYGYGGTRSADSIKPWQALSAYEAGRCLMVQIATAKNAGAKKDLIAEAKKMFQNIVTNYTSEKRVVDDAKKQLETLNRM